MTVHACSYELLSSRNTSGAAAPVDVARQQTTSAGGTSVNSEFIPTSSPVPHSAYNKLFPPHQYIRAQVVTDDSSDLMTLEVDQGLTAVQVNGVSTNNGAVCIDVDPVNQGLAARAQGRLSPSVQLRFGGAVGTALAGLTGTIQQFVMNVLHRQSSQQGYLGQCHFVDFESSPPATGGSSSEAQNILNKLADGGAPLTLGVASSGAEIQVANCSLAGIAPEGAVYVRPEDYGGSDNEQIPTDVKANTAGRFRFHPSVFVRRSQYFNACFRRVYDDVSISQDDQGQPLKIVTVDAQPTSSNWMFQIDGQIVLATVSHGVADLRRPRDIWNTIIVPAIDGSASARAALTVGIPGSSQASGGVLSRLKYLEYARCLPLAGTENNQDDTAPPG